MVDNINVVKEGVEGFDARNLQSVLLCQLDRRAQVSLYFHRPSRHIILIHDTVGLGRRNHLLHGLFTEARLEVASLRVCQIYKLVDDSSDKRADASLLQKLGMNGSLEKDACRIECNGSVSRSGQCVSSCGNVQAQLTQSCGRTAAGGCWWRPRSPLDQISESSTAPRPCRSVLMRV